ncbi:unnamed protein product [Lymnaea stagnalis]|uniref:Uncharacterized protein n=1 Tax=Lymnaea stagnalis TaxID=6523 RepID=A0AAV2H4E7_LYMST
MDYKSIFLTLALSIHLSRKYSVQGKFVDIVLQIIDSNQSNYTRFMNASQQQFLWLSSVLCDSNTYSYSITHDRDNGSVFNYSSTTFMSSNVDRTIFLKEFTCTSTLTVFQCIRLQDITKCYDYNVLRMSLSANASSKCPDKCVTMCPAYPIQSILITYDTQIVKIPNKAECQNTIPYQTSTLDSTFMSTRSSTSSPDNSKKTSPDDSLPVIVGASVGGGALIIIVIILCLVCLKMRQKGSQLKNSKQKEHSADDDKKNGSNKKKQNNHTDEVDQKTYVTDLAKVKCVNKLIANFNGTETCGCNNVNANIATNCCVDSNAIEALEKDDMLTNIKTKQRQFKPNEFSNPAFSGSYVDYSSINEVINEINNDAANNGGIYTSEPAHYSGNTYSTLGEKTRSFSDTYNIMPTVSNKKGHKSLGAISNYHNNRGNTSSLNLGDNVGQVNGASNDVYAQVIKPVRKLH